MTKALCIGGPLAGKEVEIEGETLRRVIPGTQLQSTMAWKADASKTSETKYAIYSLKVMAVGAKSEDKFWCYVPSDKDYKWMIEQLLDAYRVKF